MQTREFLVGGVQVVEYLRTELPSHLATEMMHTSTCSAGLQRDVHACGQRRLRGGQRVIEIKGNELHDATPNASQSFGGFDSALSGLGLFIGGHREDPAARRTRRGHSHTSRIVRIIRAIAERSLDASFQRSGVIGVVMNLSDRRPSVDGAVLPRNERSKSEMRSPQPPQNPSRRSARSSGTLL